MVSFFDSLLSIFLVPLLIPYFMIYFRWLLPFCLMVLLAACSSEPPYVPAAEREEKGSGDQNQGEKPSEEENGNSGSNGSNGNNGNDGESGDEGMTVIGGHRGVDLGLSVYWGAANLDRGNVGADGNPFAPGSLFKWGAIAPVSSSEAATSFPEVSVDTDIAGSGFDAATALWGGSWRMPTRAEMEELVSSCEIEWEDGGYRFTATNGESIYLPTAGYCDLLPDNPAVYDLLYISRRGYYRVSTGSVCLMLDREEGSPALITVPPYAACSIRPVSPR